MRKSGRHGRRSGRDAKAGRQTGLDNASLGSVTFPASMFEHVSIKDIARRAGVGVSTVSRVLNDHPDTNQQTRERVLRIIREVNYRPNSRARQLVKSTAETICFILNNRDVI